MSLFPDERDCWASYDFNFLGRDHTIKFSVPFVCINSFGAITFRRYFLKELLARRKRMGFSANKLPKLSRVFFFHGKSVYAVIKEFV